jgi:hypothetical protein
MTRAIVQSDFYGGPSLSESLLRAEVVKRAHAAGWKVFSLPMNRTVRPVKDAVGYPDLTLARHGEVRFLELKTEKGVLTDDQLSWFRALQPRCFVIRPLDVETGLLNEVLK